MWSQKSHSASCLCALLHIHHYPRIQLNYGVLNDLFVCKWSNSHEINLLCAQQVMRIVKLKDEEHFATPQSQLFRGPRLLDQICLHLDIAQRF